MTILTYLQDTWESILGILFKQFFESSRKYLPQPCKGQKIFGLQSESAITRIFKFFTKSLVSDMMSSDN